MNLHDTLKQVYKREHMEILRDPITRQAWGICIDTEKDIPELDALAKEEILAVKAGVPLPRTRVSIEKRCFPVGSEHRYIVTCPKSWFDLWGWADD